jgi:large subunit ribosomal protein L9
MKVILIADVKGVGRKGDVKEVSDGYAYNVLLPKKWAVHGTQEALAQHQKKMQQREDASALQQSFIDTACRQVEGKTITIETRANDQGVLFQGINESHILKALSDHHAREIPPEVLQVGESIKTVGDHEITLSNGGAFTLRIVRVE